jgi:hypothetical protein
VPSQPPTHEGGRVFVVIQEGMDQFDVISVHRSVDGAEQAVETHQGVLDKAWEHGRQSPVRAGYIAFEVEP